MKTIKANATNNFIVRFWSKKYYGSKLNQHSNIYRGTITELNSKKADHFHSAGEFLEKLEKIYKKVEKGRR